MGMLMLNRRVGERVIIETPSGEQITVCINHTSGNQVKLGFIADKDTTVDRHEIYERKQKEKEAV